MKKVEWSGERIMSNDKYLASYISYINANAGTPGFMATVIWEGKPAKKWAWTRRLNGYQEHRLDWS